MSDSALRQTFVPEEGGKTDALSTSLTRQRPFKVVPSPTKRDPAEALPPDALAASWSGLIDQIRATAARLRDKEARLQEREEHLQQLVLRTKEELQVAAERVLRAERDAHEMEVRTKREIAEWERRTLAAEEKARLMESWLARVHDTIVSEFS